MNGFGTASLDCERLSLALHSTLAPIGVLSSSSTPAETQTAREKEKEGKSAGGISAELQRPKRVGERGGEGWRGLYGEAGACS